MAYFSFHIIFLFLSSVGLGAAESAAPSYWKAPKIFMMNYTALYGDAGADAKKRWRAHLLRAKKHHIDGIVAVVPPKYFSEGCASTDIAKVCRAYLDECAAAGVECVLSMGALEDAQESDGDQRLWTQSDPKSQTLNAIAHACADSEALKGYVLHVRPRCKDMEAYVQGCTSLIASLREKDPKTTVFVKGVSADLTKISMVERIRADNVLPAADIFAYRNAYKMPDFKKDCDFVKENFCLLAVRHNPKRLPEDTRDDRTRFYCDAIEYGSQRGWSVVVWIEPAALDAEFLESLKSTISAVRTTEACAA